MNIFFLDRNPAKAAAYHCDKHTVKMIVESAQLLSTAHRVLDGDDKGTLSDERDAVLYRATHKNHPSAIWVRESVDHYRWVHDLLYYLIWEYKTRYGLDKQHKCQNLQPFLLNAPHNIKISPWVDPPQCMPDDVKHPITVYAYRLYYAKYKSTFAKWAHSDQPEWWDEVVQTIPK